MQFGVNRCVRGLVEPASLDGQTKARSGESEPPPQTRRTGNTRTMTKPITAAAALPAFAAVSFAQGAAAPAADTAASATAKKHHAAKHKKTAAPTAAASAAK